MGWSGAEDVWYNLPLVDTSWTTFNLMCEVVYNVDPYNLLKEMISGRVTDKAGNPIKGLTVRATPPQPLLASVATTNANGIYAMRAVSGATYTVYPSMTGAIFSPETQAVAVGTSTDGTTTTGNRWGINFVGATMNSALGNYELPFTTSDIPWFPDTETGTLRSGNIGGAGSTTLATTVEGPGTLTFSWAVNSMEGEGAWGGPGWFVWCLDDTPLEAPRCGVDSGGGAISVPAGTHIIGWTYYYDQLHIYYVPWLGIVDTSKDRAWVSEVVYTAPRTITAAAGPNGAIAPSGTVTVNYGGHRTFTITPDTGYYVADVLVNGGSRGAVTSYTLSNVTSDLTIEASFAKYPDPTISAAAQPHGSIWPAGVVPVKLGDSQTFFIKPWGGYKIKQVLVDGVSKSPVTTATGESYTFNNVTGDHSIIVSFEEKKTGISSVIQLLLN